MDKFERRYKTLRALALMSPEDANRVLKYPRGLPDPGDPTETEYDRRVDSLADALDILDIDLNASFFRLKVTAGAKIEG